MQGSQNTPQNTIYTAYPSISLYRPFHSTETAVICVMNDMIKAIDQGHVGALMLLDLSAAFDLVEFNSERRNAAALWCMWKITRLAG